METPGSNNSWDSQCDFVFPVKGEKETTYLYVGDRWLHDTAKGRNGQYVWLPMEFDGDRPVLRYQQDWEINARQGTWRPFDNARDLAANKPATASSQVDNNAPGNVTATKDATNYVNSHWDSDAADPQWVRIDLGKPTTFNRVVLKWNVAAAKSYRVQTSDDDQNWLDAFSTDQGTANVVADIRFATRTARYVRVYGTERAPVQVETRRRVPGNPAAATRPATQPTTRPAPPMRYSLFKVMVLSD